MFDNTKNFLEKQKTNIIITILGGLVPLLLNGIGYAFKSQSIAYLMNIDNWKIGTQTNFIIQSFFILITLYVLIQVQRYVMHDLNNSEEQIKQYIKKNCGLKIYDRNKTINSAFRTVKVTTYQFFYAWIAVWLMWLIYYGGGLLLSVSLEESYTWYCYPDVLAIYQQIFDFLNSTAMFAIYIILTNVTVNYKERTNNDYTYLESLLAWVVFFIIFIAGIIIEACAPSYLITMIMPFYVGVISTITFVLVLGKINSTYLKVPSFFMLVLYIYAIIQLYIPFSKDILTEEYKWFSFFINGIVPYITLFGKIVLMLMICWIAVQRRFLFFVIHRSTTIDRTDELLSELNKENVSF